MNSVTMVRKFSRNRSPTLNAPQNLPNRSMISRRRQPLRLASSPSLIRPSAAGGGRQRSRPTPTTADHGPALVDYRERDQVVVTHQHRDIDNVGARADPDRVNVVNITDPPRLLGRAQAEGVELLGPDAACPAPLCPVHQCRFLSLEIA
jgi:hypothetical protein